MINYHRYPIHRPDSRLYFRLIAKARDDFTRHGCCIFEQFLEPVALRRIQRETAALAHLRADQRGRSVNCYYTQPDTCDSPGHPGRILFQRQFGVIRDDMVPADAALRQLYRSDELLRFIADLVGVESLYRSRDPYQALTINCMRASEHLHWHFDCNDFAITLAIQEPQSGGELEFVHDIGRDSHAAVRQVLESEEEALPVGLRRRRIRIREGALIFFRGGESIHRVLPVGGRRERRVAAFQYHRSNDAFDDPETTRRIYGIDPEQHPGPRSLS